MAAWRDDVCRQLASVGDLRPGSLVRNYHRCSKPNFFCAERKQRGHGLYGLVTWLVQGETRSRSIPASQVEATKAQIADGRRLRRLVLHVTLFGHETDRSRRISRTQDWADGRIIREYQTGTHFTALSWRDAQHHPVSGQAGAEGAG